MTSNDQQSRPPSDAKPSRHSYATFFMQTMLSNSMGYCKKAISAMKQGQARHPMPGRNASRDHDVAVLGPRPASAIESASPSFRHGLNSPRHFRFLILTDKQTRSSRHSFAVSVFFRHCFNPTFVVRGWSVSRASSPNSSLFTVLQLYHTFRLLYYMPGDSRILYTSLERSHLSKTTRVEHQTPFNYCCHGTARRSVSTASGTAKQRPTR